MFSRSRQARTRPRHGRPSETSQRRVAIGRVAAAGLVVMTLAVAVVIATGIGSTTAAPPDPSPPSGGAAPPPSEAPGLAAKVAEAVWNKRRPAAAAATVERTWTSGPSPALHLAASGGTWLCGYHAVGAASGSTLEVRVDDLGGRVTPAPGDVVQIACQEEGWPVYQEIFVFTDERPFGSIDDLMALDGQVPVE